MNPGVGILTEQLLKAGFHDLRLLEVNDSLYGHLQKKFSKKLECYRGDFCGLWRLAYIDRQDNGERVSKILEIFPKRDWNDDFSSQIIVASGSLAFYKHLILSVIGNLTLFGHGRHEIYAVIPPILYFVNKIFSILMNFY